MDVIFICPESKWGHRLDFALKYRGRKELYFVVVVVVVVVCFCVCFLRPVSYNGYIATKPVAAKSLQTIHVPPHCTTLHETTIHYTALRYTALRYTTLHILFHINTALHRATVHYTALHYTNCLPL